MHDINIFLKSEGYYVRFDKEYFDEVKMKSNFQKWIDNDKGRLMYDYIGFLAIKSTDNDSYPNTVSQIGLARQSSLLYNPLENPGSLGQFSDKLTFEKNKMCFYPKYQQTSERKILKIEIYASNPIYLYETVHYEDGQCEKRLYNFINTREYLQTPKYYYLFDIE